MTFLAPVLVAVLLASPPPLAAAAREAGQEVSAAVFSAPSALGSVAVQGKRGAGASWKTWGILLAVAGGALLWMAYGGSGGGTGCPEPAIPEFETTTGNTIVPVGAGQRDCLTYLRR